MAGVEQITVEAGEAGMRLDRWFKVHYPGLGFGHLQKLLRSGQIRVDGGRVKADTRVEPGQSVRVPPLDVDKKGDVPLTGHSIRNQGDADVLDELAELANDAGVDEKITRGPKSAGVIYWQVAKGKTLDSAIGKTMGKTKYKSSTTTRNLRTLVKVLGTQSSA